MADHPDQALHAAQRNDIRAANGRGWRPEAAMVLAAGLGTRMRPLTDTIPKPLVVLAGRTLVDHVLDRIADAGIARAVVNVHYLADRIETHVATRRRPAIAISDERGVLLDTGGGVIRARPQLGSGPILIHNSDSVWIEGRERDDCRGDRPSNHERPSNLERLCAAFDAERMDCLLLLAERGTSLGYTGQGDFDLGADGCLARPRDKALVPYVFAGASIAAPRLLDGMPDAGTAFSLNVPWNRAIAAGRAFGLVMDGIWMHVGDPAALADAERAIARHQGPAAV